MQSNNIHSPADALSLLGHIRNAQEAYDIQVACYKNQSSLGEESKSWGAAGLRAERRFGQLLGKGEPGNKSGRSRTPNVTGGYVSNADRMARTRARKVAAVSDADFEKYMASTDKPTRAALLRNYGEHKPRKTAPKPRPNETHVTACVEGILKGKTLDEIASPLKQTKNPGKPLKPASVEFSRAYAVAQERVDTSDGQLKTFGKSSAQRLRELGKDKKQGNYSDFRHLQMEVDRAVNQLRAVLETGYVESYDFSGVEQIAVSRTANSFVEDLISLWQLLDRAMMIMVPHAQELETARKIKMLRITAGRLPEEIESFSRMADKLEKAMKKRLASKSKLA